MSWRGPDVEVYWESAREDCIIREPPSAVASTELEALAENTLPDLLQFVERNSHL